MSETGNHPETGAVEVRRRGRGSGPILLLAVLFVTATCLAWYFTWFGRSLSDADISNYLADEKNPRHVQHALLQIQQRIERHDPSSKNWYPQLIALSESPETEYRLTVAWLMGFDNTQPQFHETLLRLVKDPQPIVRRNAALALVRFDDASGRQELVSILSPYAVQAPANGVIDSILREGVNVSRGTLLARIQVDEGKTVELRSPLPGRINKIAKTNRASLTVGDEVLSISSDENSIWEALRGLSFVGGADDLGIVQTYTQSDTPRIRDQARLTAQAIQSRTTRS